MDLDGSGEEKSNFEWAPVLSNVKKLGRWRGDSQWDQGAPVGEGGGKMVPEDVSTHCCW